MRGTRYTVTLSADSGYTGSTEFLRLAVLGETPSSGIDGAMTSYTFTAQWTGEYFVSAKMGSYLPPAPGGLGYHMTLSSVARPGPVATSIVGTVDGTIRVIFDEPLQLGTTGSVSLVAGQGTGGDTWRAGDPRMRVEGNTLVLEPAHGQFLRPGAYWLQLGELLKDAHGNAVQTTRTADFQLDHTAAGGLVLRGNGVGFVLNGSASQEDVVVYDGYRSDYVVGHDASGFTVSLRSLSLGDMLSGIERVMFTKDHDVVALSLDGHLGQAFRLYTAAFGRVPDKDGLGFWLHAADSGVSLPSMARGFIDSKEFGDLYGTHPDNGSFVASLYRNVLHREGESAGLAFWTGALAAGADRADVLAAVSESTENQQLTVGLIGDGILFTPYG